MFEEVLDFIFPRRCFSCGRIEDYLCSDCLNKKLILQNNCFLCNDKDNSSRLKNCNTCRDNIMLDGIISFFDYKDSCIKEMMKFLKFRYSYNIGKYFGEVIGNIFNERYKLDENYILIPVPISKKRLNERGFNQSYIFANELSKKININIYPDVLIKDKNTADQVGLTQEERSKNLKSAFSVKYDKIIKYNLYDKNVILVDDVVTTGSTVANCAMILKNNRFKKVFVLTIART
ncbi:ComF family protein [Patescibacteria group bacterium]|nr:ComF family protein [Patescibacteria group bacterium]